MGAPLFILGGFLAVGLAVLGIFLPLLPTTPFLLLAAFCFARGSQRWHRWLLSHRIFGPYIQAFREGRGLSVQQKWRIALAASVLLGLTLWFTPATLYRVGISLIWGGLLFYLLLSRTARS